MKEGFHEITSNLTVVLWLLRFILFKFNEIKEKRNKNNKKLNENGQNRSEIGLYKKCNLFATKIIIIIN